MPETTGGERSLPASPLKRQRARDEGNVARSQDLNVAVTLLLALLALRMLGPYMFAWMLEGCRYYLGEARSLAANAGMVQYVALDALRRVALCALPIMGILLIGGLAVNVLQVGFLFTARPLVPQLNRLNPLTGFQRFFTLRALIELAKSVLKLFFVGWVVWWTIRPRMDVLVSLMDTTPEGVVAALCALVGAVWWRIALAMLVLGILDYGFQYWQHGRDLMMTVQEARLEAREMEGDPHIKARVRQIQRQMAMQRMMREVPAADVVITNPTTYAVALRYDVTAMAAPVVVAKGARILADRIRDAAIEHSVPIVRKPELARALYRTIELNQPVPEKLFRAVAEVLAYVYEIDRRSDKVRERRQHLKPVRQAV